MKTERNLVTDIIVSGIFPQRIIGVAEAAQIELNFLCIICISNFLVGGRSITFKLAGHISNYLNYDRGGLIALNRASVTVCIDHYIVTRCKIFKLNRSVSCKRNLLRSVAGKI